MHYKLSNKVSIKKLHLIKNPIKKLHQLYSNYDDAFKVNEKKLIGLVDMIGALEYHYSKHRNIEKKYTPYIVIQIDPITNRPIPFNLLDVQNSKKKINKNHLSYEACAYLNRLGQVYYFLMSSWIHNSICNIERIKKGECASKKCKYEFLLIKHVPILLALMPIRNKITAHRQQDYPASDDCTDIGFNFYKLQHISSGPTGSIPSIQYTLSSVNQRNKILERYSIPAVSEVEYSNNGSFNGFIVNFKLSDLHPKIITGILNLIEELLRKE